MRASLPGTPGAFRSVPLLGAALAPWPLAAQETPTPGEGPAGVTTERSAASLEISGRINQGVLYADGGEDDKLFLVDNDNSGSRFGLVAETGLGRWTAGAVLVIGVEVNSTDEIKFDDTTQVDERFGEGDIGELRQAHWFVEHPRFGLVSFGQGDEAGEGASEADVSGTTLVAQSDVDDTAGGLEFALLADDDADEIDDFFVNLDADRSVRALYETPQFAGGAAVRFSLTQSDEIEPGVALVYGAEPGGYRIEAALGWRRPDGGDEPAGDVIHGSVSALAPFGASATLAGGTFALDEGEVDDPDFLYVKLGYATGALSSLGATSFSVDYFVGHDNPAFADGGGGLPEATSIGAGAVQDIDALSTELYLGVRNYAVRDVSVDGAPVADPDDLLAVLAGARVRF